MSLHFDSDKSMGFRWKQLVSLEEVVVRELEVVQISEEPNRTKKEYSEKKKLSATYSSILSARHRAIRQLWNEMRS